MTPPPIRYPLPTLLVVVVAAVLAWNGEALTRPLRATLAEQWASLTAGPPVPSSPEPRVAVGSIGRRVLLLRGNVVATDRPGGSPVETIRRRGFFDLYDLWPIEGSPTHHRIGNNGRPIGWVQDGDVLPWDTRLTLRLASGSVGLADRPGGPLSATAVVGDVPLPVLSWTPTAALVAFWSPSAPWERVGRLGWLDAALVPEDAWCALVAREEIQLQIRRLVAPDPPADPSSIRLQAILGLLGLNRSLDRADREAAWSWLPPWLPRGKPLEPSETIQRLSDLNQNWKADVSWGGLGFRAVPIMTLP